ncbi:hypothetical protein PIB30_005748 [Stylosanthes scabra]|uniref:CDC20/Fizzy WD40 domain-containing protein n=1 Tax=Stylosanthes scabra TaxID=79078 RepID=A0ABU6W791_9FABA|nr:hypothetical protein [Stylosanthes scabra]
MDAGTWSSSRKITLRKASQENLDRFIPNRSAMDFSYAHCILTERKKEEENPVPMSVESHAYKMRLAEALNMNQSRILAFKNRPPTPKNFLSPPPPQPQRKRYIPRTSENKLDAPGILDDFYLNLLDWGSSNVLSIALGNTVYLWDASDRSTSELVTIDDDDGPVTSVCWAPGGRHLAIGLNNSHVQVWDSATCRLLRTLRGVHQSRVGSLAWNKDILTTGSTDGKIVDNDIRVGSHIVGTYTGHHQLCNLKWSVSGKQLASAGHDNLVRVWDRSMASSNSPTRWLHRLDEHRAAVKALAWCPFQANLLASGGGGDDQGIKFWNTDTGACLNTVSTGSQVCALLWSKKERELLSSHQNKLILWKYPSMLRLAELTGHRKGCFT